MCRTAESFMDHENENSGMGESGVSRPMPMHHNKSQKMKMGKPQSEERQKIMQTHHQQTLWVYWSLVMLGFWLIATPLTFGYDTGLVSPFGVLGAKRC